MELRTYSGTFLTRAKEDAKPVFRWLLGKEITSERSPVMKVVEEQNMVESNKGLETSS